VTAGLTRSRAHQVRHDIELRNHDPVAGALRNPQRLVRKTLEVGITGVQRKYCGTGLASIGDAFEERHGSSIRSDDEHCFVATDLFETLESDGQMRGRIRRRRPSDQNRRQRWKIGPARFVVEVCREVPRILGRSADDKQAASFMGCSSQRVTERPRAFDPTCAGEEVAHERDARAVHAHLRVLELAAYPRVPAQVWSRTCKDQVMTDSRSLASIDFGTIGILGGTGDQGRGLAYRWGLAGLDVVIGSRDAARAAAAASEIAPNAAGAPGARGVRGASNLDVSAQADIVVVAVPWDGHAELLRSLSVVLAGKVVVDCVNPLGFDERGAYALEVEEGSAAQQAAALLPDSRVVAAFHHLSSVLLNDPAVGDVECDIMVLGDDRGATDIVQLLASAIGGARGIYGGRLRNAHQVEALTANLISVNRRHRTRAGVRLTGV
jgi:8-hydroxy-5-deazaflavin:NADPH oxidoreductase